ncbi:unnamed protein product [Cyprideis torosa]|uniref:Alpha-2-macroglobulin RAP C-terminal domain-containing protein n=1 Tax=Cyprideis torosa TaxID=163714 RepID=A0A7R8WHB5_9CRUS|nr:unnamed protein product [Cyprideis torosa]CAG0892730.1 unnamed protein product [Cyprideis torosa]
MLGGGMHGLDMDRKKFYCRNLIEPHPSACHRASSNGSNEENYGADQIPTMVQPTLHTASGTMYKMSAILLKKSVAAEHGKFGQEELALLHEEFEHQQTKLDLYHSLLDGNSQAVDDQAIQELLENDVFMADYGPKDTEAKENLIK